jgi:hypothetical protein
MKMAMVEDPILFAWNVKNSEVGQTREAFILLTLYVTASVSADLIILV